MGTSLHGQNFMKRNCHLRKRKRIYPLRYIYVDIGWVEKSSLFIVKRSISVLCSVWLLVNETLNKFF